jgi:hypothetical protein
MFSSEILAAGIEAPEGSFTVPLTDDNPCPNSAAARLKVKNADRTILPLTLVPFHSSADNYRGDAESIKYIHLQLG